MSSNRFASPRSLFSLSLSRLPSPRDGEDTRTRASTNESDVPSGRRESPAHVASPRPEFPILYITPEPRDDIVAPKSPVAPTRRRGTVESTIRLLRAQCEPSNTQRMSAASKFIQLRSPCDRPFFFRLSFSFPQDDKSTKISPRSYLTTYFFQST